MFNPALPAREISPSPLASMSSTDGEFISPASVSLDQEADAEADHEIFSSPLLHQSPLHIPTVNFNLTADATIQRLRQEEEESKTPWFFPSSFFIC